MIGLSGVKSVFASKTVWGILVSLVSTVLQLLGVVSISSQELNTLLDWVVQAATLISQIGGMLFAIYGRIAARERIG